MSKILMASSAAASIITAFSAGMYLQAAEMPPLPPDPNEAFFGARIPRTMTLLATSDAARRNPVRILCYGQSIVAQGYVSRAIAAELGQRYPFAKITVENRAIGGYTAPTLVRTAIQDLYPFYPDLVVFHVYDGHDTGELERIVANIRKYTTAEILMWTHHLDAFGPDGTERDPIRDEASNFRNYLAQKYNCELVELREDWKAYVKANNIPRRDLLCDDIHLNEKGGALQAQLIMRHFRYNTLFPCGWMNTVRTYEARRALEERADEITFTGAPWPRNNKGVSGNDPKSALRLAFHGNRVDVIPFPAGDKLGTAKILIDGKAPSSFASAFAITRTNSNPISGRPMLNRINVGAAPVAEDWTLNVNHISEDGKTFTFSLSGSVTGPDGEGSQAGLFTSKSGRISFDPKEFTFEGAAAWYKKPFPSEVVVSFKTVLMGMDTWAPTPITDKGAVDVYTLIQGIDNGDHVLEIVPNGDGPLPVYEVVAHRPPLE
ncbi:MAG: SGNH/GDSL hydrolase family protein [Opitutaceae bacterium]